RRHARTDKAPLPEADGSGAPIRFRRRRGCAAPPSGGRGLGLRIPTRSEFASGLNVGGKIDLTPFLARDVERPHFTALREVMDHPQVPYRRALRCPQRALDRLAKSLGAAGTKGE